MISEWEWKDVRQFYVDTILHKTGTPYGEHARRMLIVVESMMSDDELSTFSVDMRLYDIQISKDSSTTIVSVSTGEGENYILSIDEFVTNIQTSMDEFKNNMLKLIDN